MAAGIKSGEVSPLLAEAIGLKEVLSWIKRRGPSLNSFIVLPQTKIVIESDCLQLVQALKNTQRSCSPTGLVISDCKKLIQDCPNISFSFVKRSGNKAAHWLARHACSGPGRTISRGSVPAAFEAILLADG